MSRPWGEPAAAGRPAAGRPVSGEGAAEPAEVECEQLYWGWAPRTLSGAGAGYGVIAHSAEWPGDVRDDRTAGLGASVDFLGSNAVGLMDRHPVPQCVLVRRAAEGTTVLCKTYLGVDAFGRPSNYLVSALLDVSGRLTPWDALVLASCGVLVADVAEEDHLRRDLPTRPVTVTPAPPAPLFVRMDDSAFWVLLVTAVLIRLRTRGPGPVVVELQSSSDALQVIGSLLGLLPAGLATQVSFSTFERNPAGASVDVCCAVVPYSVEPMTDDGLVIRLDGANSVPDAPGERALAEALVQGALGQVGDRPPDDVTTVDDLFRWSYLCSLLQSAPGKLSPEEITYVLSSAAAADWLRRPGALETTLARLDRENVEPAALESVLASLLASDDALRVELADPLSVMAVDAFVYTPQTGASDRRALERLLGVVHPNGIQALLPVMLATATEALAGEDAVGVDMETMAPLVVANGGRLSTDQHRRWLEHPEVRDLLGAGWNPLSETAVGDALTASGDVQPLVAALARFPDRVAELVDAAVNDGRMDDEELVALWRRLPPPCLPDLTGVLLRCPGLHKDVLLYRLLDDPRLEESSPLHVTVLVPLLQRYWRELAAAARFPAAVSAALAPVWPRTDAVAGENGSGGEDPGYPPDNGDHDESVATTGWRSWRRGRGRHPT